MKDKAEKYARDAVARMRLSGFTHYESERVRSFLENAYMAGHKAARRELINLEAAAVRENREVWGRIITEDVIMKNETI